MLPPAQTLLQASADASPVLSAVGRLRTMLAGHAGIPRAAHCPAGSMQRPPQPPAIVFEPDGSVTMAYLARDGGAGADAASESAEAGPGPQHSPPSTAQAAAGGGSKRGAAAQGSDGRSSFQLDAMESAGGGRR